jgi:hypothetical protein
VSLDALSCVLQEFFSGITALFCGAPHYSNTIVDGIRNRTGGTGSLVSRFSDLICGSFQYRL